MLPLSDWVCPVPATPAYNLSLKGNSVSPTLQIHGAEIQRHNFCPLHQSPHGQPAGPRVHCLTVSWPDTPPVPPSSTPYYCTIMYAVFFSFEMGYLTSSLLDIFTSRSSRSSWLLQPSTCCLSLYRDTKAPPPQSGLSLCCLSCSLMVTMMALLCVLGCAGHHGSGRGSVQLVWGMGPSLLW